MPYSDKNDPRNKKSKTIYQWKKRGLKETNEFIEQIYEEYLNSEECQLCGEPYKKNKKDMEHCHITGKFRNICCHRCNMWKSDKAVKYINFVKSLNLYRIRINREGKYIVDTTRKKKEDALKLLEETKLKYPHYFT
tara:strand:+ start:131 stop:538 length:408 start_codon:yes stop_codon:yes gene_type:complete